MNQWRVRVVGLGLVVGVACVPDPVHKSQSGAAGTAGGQSGSIAIMTGDAGTSGEAGTPGAAGDTGAAGGSGTTGAAGTTGDAGTSGSAGDTGAAGTDGDAGTSGSAGDTGAAGTDGDAGAVVDTGPPIVGCDRANWTFTPSVVCTTACAAMSAGAKLPANAIDGDMSTRWTTGLPQGSKGPENVVLSFAAPVSLTGLTLYAKATTDFPNMYLVEYSTDGTTFQGFTPALAGPGMTTLILAFPGRTTVRAVRITQTGTSTHWWSINELNVVGCMMP